MLGHEQWAQRTGASSTQKRYTITITVPVDFQKK
jgi:hypothetical protein